MNKARNIPDRQRGAALIVGLVLMTVLTLLAVSTMRTSTLELAMAGNTQYHEQAVQLAETGIKDAVSRINSGAQNLNGTDGWLVTFSEAVQTPAGDSLGQYDVTISFKENGKPPANYSEDINALYFEIESTGRSTARNAQSTLRQGFWWAVQ
ncbi:MAG: PilX N-terminal domain-containing pilus assembly protein [Gammaproteobacteria bacterium]|jgi:hypothetical protein|nr:hypothetical protein [Chromatiales bacterium]MDP6416745.1 PilX N-terminal domain-containing pilus assembly protein [Gammaproteobacteria bacterium]MDP6673858.1 PilX N-terminal domain-containing pilus assembly protein [Gammaproteobacteria bacterium]